MKMGRTVIGLALGIVLICGAGVTAQQDQVGAAQATAQGNALLKQGDFPAALEAFRKAAQAADATQSHKQEFMRVRRMIKMREMVEKEKDQEKWWKTAKTLRNFYYKYRLYKELNTLAARMHAQRKSPGSATVLADSLLLLNQDAKAEAVLTAAGQDKLSLQGKALLGIALARQQKTKPAQAVLAVLQLGDDASPRLMHDVARIKVLCGDVDGGMAMLCSALKKTSPKGIAGFKEFIASTPEFSKPPAKEHLAKVLLTESAMSESDCSGGADCGSCPSKNGCSDEKKKETHPDKKKSK
jgi:tetratricopeptide (TPR) repeat protein